MNSYQSVYGDTFLKVIRTVPREDGGWYSSTSIAVSSSISLSLSSSFSFFLATPVTEGTGPIRSTLAADRRNPRISNWLDRIFLSWSVIPFPDQPQCKRYFICSKGYTAPACGKFHTIRSHLFPFKTACFSRRVASIAKKISTPLSLRKVTVGRHAGYFA